MVYRLCAVSVFCGLACQLTPEGAIRRVCSLLTVVALLLCLRDGIGSWAFTDYAAALAENRRLEAAVTADAEALRNQLDRQFIEQQLCEYVRQKAEERDITLGRLEFGLRWDTDGYWVPESLKAEVTDGRDRLSALQSLIVSELGIPLAAQDWEG